MTEAKKKDKLWELCKKFIVDNQISCGEAVYQCDWASEHSPGLVCDILDLVGSFEQIVGDEVRTEVQAEKRTQTGQTCDSAKKVRQDRVKIGRTNKNPGN